MRIVRMTTVVFLYKCVLKNIFFLKIYYKQSITNIYYSDFEQDIIVKRTQEQLTRSILAKSNVHCTLYNTVKKFKMRKQTY